jgi:hypothetical protein
MRLVPVFLSALPVALSLTIRHASYNIPSAHESAVLARRILNLSKIGTLSTVFQHSSRPLQDDNDGINHEHAHVLSDQLAGTPIGLIDYFADCDREDTGNPTILAIDIATSFRNVLSGSNISLSVQWVPPYPPSKRISLWSWLSSPFNAVSETPDPFPYSAANQPRFSLIGYLESLDDGEINDGLAECFIAKHPDAQYWLPGNRIHRSHWVRLVVTHLYWIGGFGDRAYIGWIPAELYNSVTREQWETVRLPGEKPGWHEWSISYGTVMGKDVDTDL